MGSAHIPSALVAASQGAFLLEPVLQNQMCRQFACIVLRDAKAKCGKVDPGERGFATPRTIGAKAKCCSSTSPASTIGGILVTELLRDYKA